MSTCIKDLNDYDLIKNVVDAKIFRQNLIFTKIIKEEMVCRDFAKFVLNNIIIIEKCGEVFLIKRAEKQISISN